MESNEEEVQLRSDRHRKIKKGVGSSVKLIVVALVSALILALLAYTIILYGGKLLVDEEKLIITPPTTIETSDGEIIWYLYDEYRLPVKLDEIPEHVKEAFIATEDKRYYTHSGVDIKSIFRAIYKDVIARDKVEGASTITQQLAKNVFLTNDKTWLRKTKEIMIALHLEREYTKDEILEMYLNVIYFGHGQYGVEAAANKYFFKSISDLTLEEGAVLAGMIKAPNTFSPINNMEKSLARRNLALQSMHQSDYITKEELEAAMETNINLDISDMTPNPAHHSAADLARKEAEDIYGLSLEDLKAKRYRIITSINTDMQMIAYEQFKFSSYFPGNNDKVQGAFVMMDQEKGEIVAAISGRDYKYGNTNRVRVKRQPGSAIKPIVVFAPALMTGDFDAYTYIPDKKQTWPGGEDGKPYEPKNSNDQYVGSIPFIEALKQSKNTSSVWLLNEIGIDYAKSYLEKMDINIPDEGLPIALGGLEDGITPLEMTEAYRTFVHEGKKISAHSIVEIHDYKGNVIGKPDLSEEEVFTPQVSWNITEMLMETVRSGTATDGEYVKELAGKTGTTQHPHVDGSAKDAWFVGYTPEYVTALWMGFDESTEENYLTGGSSFPTIMTKRILTEIDMKLDLASEFVKPEDVKTIAEQVKIPVITDLKATYIFGGFKILKGKLRWTATLDDNIVYKIYKEAPDEDVFIGEVTGKGEFIVDDVSIFKNESYYVTPTDTVSGVEGKRSESVLLAF